MNQTSPAPQLSASLNTRLSLMMFLQYGVWGAWLPILYPFLMGHRGFTLEQAGYILSIGAVGAIIGPFLAGQIADRWFSTEKFLGISHVIGAVIVWTLAETAEFWTFFWLSLAYGFVYAPTLALTNSLAFHHLPDRDRDFGRVRVWGTIGWIAVGIGVGHWLLFKHTPAELDEAAITAAQNAGRADAFKLSALLGAFMGLFCFTLPKTPPASDAAESNATFEALSEIRRQPLITLFLLTIPISCIHQFYFVYTASFLGKYQAALTATEAGAGGFVTWFNSTIEKVFGVGGGGLMTIGQMSEIFVLALIPVFAKQVSRKTFLMIGTLAYAARMALFAYYESIPLPSTVTLILGVMLHGLCFGCFIFVAFMIVDEETTADVRASAQNLYNMVIVGVGIILGSWISTALVGKHAQYETGEVDAAGEAIMAMDYTKLFSAPMYGALAVLLLLLVLYPSRSRQAA
ncbi:MAG: nucleoside permease [bacterium]|nr:nucleoside permease [bacterium]